MAYFAYGQNEYYEKAGLLTYLFGVVIHYFLRPREKVVRTYHHRTYHWQPCYACQYPLFNINNYIVTIPMDSIVLQLIRYSPGDRRTPCISSRKNLGYQSCLINGYPLSTYRSKKCRPRIGLPTTRVLIILGLSLEFTKGRSVRKG